MTSDAADRTESVSPRPASGDGPPTATDEPRTPAPGAGPTQSTPAPGPPPRSALAEKARTLPRPSPSPRRTVADVAQAAAAGKAATAGAATPTQPRPAARPKSTRDHGADGSDHIVARERPGGPWPMPERSLMATVLGVHPAAAVGVAAALTAVGVAVDLLRTGTLGTAFTVCYLTGCVLATAWVRRSGLFWPMVAPPLLMAVAVPVVVLLEGAPRPGAGIAGRLLVIGAPLVNGFPMMAWTTGLVLALGLFRLVTQRVSGRRGVARAAGRTSTSPPRS